MTDITQNGLRIKIVGQLQSLKDSDYKEFNDKLIPGVENTIGIRVPAIRSLAKEMVSGKFQQADGIECIKALQDTNTEEMYYEEKMLQGILVGTAKLPLEERIEYIRGFVPRIDNWAVCDSFCGSLKFIDKTEGAKAAIWELFQEYLQREAEFDIRFGVVGIMGYYIDKEHIAEVLKLMNQVGHQGYYVKMGVAWALSVCYVKFPKETMAYFKSEECKLDDFTYNKAIQKTRESFRVPGEDKEILNKMKRK